MNKLKSLTEVKADQALKDTMQNLSDRMRDLIQGQTPEQFAQWVHNLSSYERKQWETRMEKAKTSKRLENPYDNLKIGGY